MGEEEVPVHGVLVPPGDDRVPAVHRHVPVPYRLVDAAAVHHQHAPVPGRPCVLHKLRGTRYALQPILTKPAPDTVVIAVIRPLPDEARRRLAAPLLHAADWLELNPWLVMNRQDRRSMLLAARIVRPDAFAWEEYRALARGAVRFYQLSPEPVKP